MIKALLHTVTLFALSAAAVVPTVNFDEEIRNFDLRNDMLSDDLKKQWAVKEKGLEETQLLRLRSDLRETQIGLTRQSN